MAWLVLNVCWWHRWKAGGRQARRHQRQQAWDTEDLSWMVVAMEREQAPWPGEGRMDELGDMLDLVPHFKSTSKCLQMTCPLSHCHVLMVGKYKKEREHAEFHHQSTTETLASFLLVLSPRHFSFCS